MAIIKCKMCGGDLRIEEGTTVAYDSGSLVDRVYGVRPGVWIELDSPFKP